MQDPREVVTVYKAANSTEAFVICNALRNEGIDCQATETNDPLGGLTIAEPDILVRQADQQRAEEIIAEYEQQRLNDVGQDTEVDEDDGLGVDGSDLDHIEVEEEDADR